MKRERKMTWIFCPDQIEEMQMIISKTNLQTQQIPKPTGFTARYVSMGP